MRVFIAGLAVLLTFVSAAAQEQILIAGAGAQPCSTIVRMHRSDKKPAGLFLITYVQGFWTGLNSTFMQAGAPLKNLAGDNMAHLDNLLAECGRRPSTEFGIVARDYFYKLPSVPHPLAK